MVSVGSQSRGFGGTSWRKVTPPNRGIIFLKKASAIGTLVVALGDILERIVKGEGGQSPQLV